jgi:hypothetical protein
VGDELSVPPGVLSDIQGELGKGSDAIEGTAGSAPRAIDAGEMTAMLTGMMSKVLDQAAALSEGLSGVCAQVGEADTHFWETDEDVSTSYGGGRPLPQ